MFLPQASFAAQGDYVVLLHGIARTKGSMEGMGEALSQKGYVVINIDYESRKKKIEDLIVDIRKEIVKNHIPEAKKINFIGHSMGGLIIRAYINKYRPENIGRVVMLGTPNQGSEVADFLADNTLYRSFYGPAGQELITDQSDFKKIFGEVDYELGVIAGNCTVDPVSSFIIPGDDDGKVAIARTRIKGMKDHIILCATHSFMPGNKQVKRQAEYFLEHGKFRRKIKGSEKPHADL
ncbi:MAG: alpha/beta fold hydrolase [Pseudomonadota bacterium]